MWAYLGVAAYQVISGYQQAEMIREQAKLKQQIDDMNADDALLDAYNAEKEGFSESARYGSVVNSTVGEQRVAYAANNVDVNYGTAADVQDETRLVGAMNVLEIQRRAREKAAGYKKEARNIRLQGGFNRAQAQLDASGAQTRGITSGMSTFVTGYTNTKGFKKPVKDMEVDGQGNKGINSGQASREFRRGNLAFDTTGIA